MKTKLFLTTFALFALLLVGKLNAQFGGGNGTEADPYQITSKADMEALADSVNNGNYWSKDKHFKLMKDINDSIRFCIGKYDEDNLSFPKAFQGNFDGNNKKITLALNFLFEGYVGLFNCVYNGIIENLVVDGYVNGIYSVGAICGYARNSYIINCTNYGKISAIAQVGGISGYNIEVDISNCVNYGEINATISTYSSAHIGGISGYNGKVNILNCVNYGNVNGDTFIGGIAGISNAKIINCKNYGNVDGRTCVGGIIGHTEVGCNISYCVNSGSVTATNYGVGGIAGHFKGDTISYCVNIGTITGKKKTINIYPSAEAGGIVGMGGFEKYEHFVSLIDKCINSGLVTGTTSTGGIIGRAYNLDKVSNCINTGAVSSSSGAMGCIAGEVEYGSTIINCHYDKQMCGGKD